MSEERKATMLELEKAVDFKRDRHQAALAHVHRLEKRFAVTAAIARSGVMLSLIAMLVMALIGAWFAVGVNLGMVLVGTMCRLFSAKVLGSNIESARQRRDDALSDYVDALTLVDERQTLKLMSPEEYECIETYDERKRAQEEEAYKRRVNAMEQLALMQREAKIARVKRLESEREALAAIILHPYATVDAKKYAMERIERINLDAQQRQEIAKIARGTSLQER